MSEFKEKPLSTARKLEIIIDLIEAGESVLAIGLVEAWGRQYRVIDPVIAKFLFPQGGNPRQYWLEYEPMLSDLKEELEKAKQAE